MMSVSKILTGAAGVGMMAVSLAAVPAVARDNAAYIPSSLMVGGGTGFGSPLGADRYGYDGDYARYGYRDGYGQGDSRRAVGMCIRAAERDAGRASYGRAKVTDIRDVDRKNDGYTVKGRIAVNTMGRAWRAGDGMYGRGWDGDYRGWNNRYRGYDAGSFTCRVRYGRVTDIDYKNIRGL